MKVAVYGTLKQGFGNHCVLGPCELHGSTMIEGYRMVSLGGCPGIIVGDGKVQVEVYTITPEQLPRVDALEGHPDWYKRTPVDTEYGPASVYVLPHEEYKDYPAIEDGIWKGDYYVEN